MNCLRAILVVPILVLAGLLLFDTASALRSEVAIPDVSMNDQLQLFVTIESDFDLVDSGTPIYFNVDVVDQHRVPVKGALISIALEGDGGAVIPSEALTDSQGTARFKFVGESLKESVFLLTASATYEGAIPDTDTFEIRVFNPPPPQRKIQRIEVVTVGLGALIIATFVSTEAGRYGLFNTLVFPLYTRLKKEEVLDHFVRGQIYGYILSNPGEYFSSIREVLKVTNGTLSHHLRTLEMQGFIKSTRDGIRKRFYPVHMIVPRSRGLKLSDLQLGILEVIKRKGGPTQKEIADQLGVSQQCISYNLRILSREGILRIEREGRQKKYYFERNF